MQKETTIVRMKNLALSCAAMALAICFIAPIGAIADSQGVSAETGITDQALLDLVGVWTGPYTMGEEAGLGELTWNLAFGNQWLQGTLKFWKGNDKNTLVYDEFIFLRPTEPGVYKGYTVDNFGVAQIAKGSVKDGVWQWLWNYDDGHVENGVMNTTDPDKTTYRGVVVDKDGKPAGDFTFDMTRVKR
jgi:hypothetical protein